MSRLLGWRASINSATLTAIAALADTSINLEGANGYVVPDLENEVWAAAAIGSDLTQARIVAPSFDTARDLGEILPISIGTDAFDLDRNTIMMPMRPIPLKSGEVLQVSASEDNAGADIQTVLLWLKAPGELPAVPPGRLIKSRATGAATLGAGVWTAFTPTLEQELEAGRYAVVGIHASSATAQAVRLIIPGQSNRPGVLAKAGAAAAARDFGSEFNKGLQMYNMGEFRNTSIPQFEFLAVAADTTQEIVMDLVKVE